MQNYLEGRNSAIKINHWKTGEMNISKCKDILYLGGEISGACSL